ncbi:hypothetical protein [Streptomyces sp. SLBN-31]|uniref:hypothetical protein n=1 Tax=Streptomyces sp. SLBN-31 TaxID=2768444 RepID=UPI00116CE120|nr:hypothetical protein [Streptomyces sp. SLBN-31]TQJ86557.1 hypothetical protein FBY22_5374 [Streptomyces sp. SLBN-31]
MSDERAERIAEFIAPLRVKPGSEVDLSTDFDPGFKAGIGGKEDGQELLRPVSRCWPTTSGGRPPKTHTGC